MEFSEVVKERRSIRKFINKKIEREKIENIIKMASYAPSWKNTQISRYTVIEDRKCINKIAQDCVLDFEFNRNIIKNAPMIIVISTISQRSGYEKDGSFSTSKGDRWEMFDAGIATQTFCLAACNEGVGSVVMGIFDEEKLHEVLNLPENQKVAAILALGYSDEKPIMPRRKDLEELITYI